MPSGMSCHVYTIYYILCPYVASLVAFSAVTTRSPTSRGKLFHTVLNLKSSVCLSAYESDLSSFKLD